MSKKVLVGAIDYAKKDYVVMFCNGNGDILSLFPYYCFSFSRVLPYTVHRDTGCIVRTRDEDILK